MNPRKTPAILISDTVTEMLYSAGEVRSGLTQGNFSLNPEHESGSSSKIIGTPNLYVGPGRPFPRSNLPGEIDENGEFSPKLLTTSGFLLDLNLEFCLALEKCQTLPQTQVQCGWVWVQTDFPNQTSPTRMLHTMLSEL